MNNPWTYYLIANPRAASGSGADAVKAVEQVLKGYGKDVQTYVPESAQETEDLVRRLTGTGDDGHLIVMGGDGTLNTVLNGIADFDHTRLSCIPVGSGNDFARNMHLIREPKAAAQHLLTAPQEICLDYGEAMYEGPDGALRRRFAISCGIGYDADICEEAARHPAKRMLNRLGLGKLIYLLVGIRQMFSRTGTRAVIRLDEREPIHLANMFFTVGMIHPKEGGGVPFCPKADPTDSLLDVCMAKYMTHLKSMAALVMVYLGCHHLISRVRLARCRKLEVVTEKPQWYHLDGDTDFQIRKIIMTAKSGLRFVR